MTTVRDGKLDDRVVELLDTWTRAEHDWHREMMETLDYPPTESVVEDRKRIETVHDDEWLESTVVTGVTR